MATTHILKTEQPFFDDVTKGVKMFELREDDRGFKVGDTLLLREYNKSLDCYTGKQIRARVRYILRKHKGVAEGWCIMDLYDITLEKVS